MVIKKAAGVMASLAVVMVLLVSSIDLVIYKNPGYFEREYRKYGVQQDVDMEMSDLLYVTEEMTSYLKGGREDLNIVTTVGGEEREFFSAREKAHMKDVKALFWWGIQLRRLGFVIAAGVILWAIGKNWIRLFAKCFLATAGTLMTVTAALAVVVSSDFDRYFTLFHHIFFDNDLWILDPRVDLLIQIVPQPFFMDTAFRIVIVFGALLFAVGLVSFFTAKGRYGFGIFFLALLFLKLVGWIFLIVLGLLLLLLLTPIRYRLFAEKFEKLGFGVWIGWLFGILQFRGQLDGNQQMQLQVKVFGISIFGSGAKKKKERTKKQDAPAPAPEEVMVSMRSRQDEPVGENGKQEETTQKPSQDTEPQKIANNAKEAESKTVTEIPKPKPRRVNIEQLEETEEREQDDSFMEDTLPDDFFEPDNGEKKKKGNYLHQFMEIPNKKEILQAVIKLLKRLFRGVLPRDFYMQARVGTGDPALTGYLCGAVGVLKMQFGDHVQVTGDFGKMTLENVRVKGAGKIVPGYLVYACLRFLFTKSVWQLVKVYWKGKR